ncbi:aminopeptidase P family protein [Litorimonas sp. RW-G-Af-16]|uniref:aminopeptidase P family protein n=1 Tax=Litorimonas sp. RW-G-Af-16 TaxID=3241168 RepID=UPI00390C9687
MQQDISLFQTYDVKGGPDFGRRNLPKLRAQLAELGLSGFLVPHEDEYQNEYLPDCNERLMWVSGFTGSAGAAIVRLHDAVMFVDGRYTLQAAQQVDDALFSFEAMAQGSHMESWLRAHAETGEIYGYDPRLHSPSGLQKLEAAVALRGAELRALATNPIDVAWNDRPPQPLTPIRVQPLKFAGKSHADKRAEIAKSIADQGADAALITAPASIAWLLNIRGGDVQCTPLPLSTAIIDKHGKVDFFVAPEKLTPEVQAHLGNEVAIKAEGEIGAALAALKGQTVIADPNTSSAYYFTALKSAGATVKAAQDPVALPKACKNAAEIAGTTAAHIRDAGALVQFLHWLDTTAQSGEVDEIEAATQLELFRHTTKQLRDLSFESISGAGSNGAVVHYRVNQDTNLRLEKGSLFLIDSGGQYDDGTTDVTRTVPIGEPTQEMRERFTLVLKGHIALATVRFPEGTTGSALDALARHPLWQAGLDYDHGTGHGVGVFLGVHEGPQRISKAPNNVALRPGMIVSNEPGYYKTGEYGIRIENLQYVTPPEDVGGERKMLGFKNLTWAPIHRALVEVDLLSLSERDYLNTYHAQVWETVSDLVDGDVRDWLKAACAPI